MRGHVEGPGAKPGRGSWLVWGALIAALVGVSGGGGYLVALRVSRTRATSSALAERDIDEGARSQVAPGPVAGSPVEREAAPAPASLRRERTTGRPSGSVAASAVEDPEAAAEAPAPPAPVDDADSQVKSLPAVEGILSRLKDRARARHDVTIDEIDPGVRAIRRLAGQLSPDEVIHKEAQFAQEMLQLSRQFSAARTGSDNH